MALDHLLLGRVLLLAGLVAGLVSPSALPRGAMSSDAYAESRRRDAAATAAFDRLPPPPVFFTRNLLDKAACDAIIAASNAHGWSMQLDSIGGFTHASQDIYVYDVGRALAPDLLRLIEPMLERLIEWAHEVVGPLKVNEEEWRRIAAELDANTYGMKARERDRAERERGQTSRADMMAALAEKSRNHRLPASGLHTTDWIFIRKYSAEADSKRDHLAGHRDTNQFSVNLPLNSDDEFEGGKLWFARNDNEEHTAENRAINAANANTVKGQSANPSVVAAAHARGLNSSRFFVPKLDVGRAIIHNNQVLHGISPITKGTKYSLLFFLDMPVRPIDRDHFRQHHPPRDGYEFGMGGSSSSWKTSLEAGLSVGGRVVKLGDESGLLQAIVLGTTLGVLLIYLFIRFVRGFAQLAHEKEEEKEKAA